MPALEHNDSGSAQALNEALERRNITLTPEQKQQLAAKLLEMLRRDLQQEQARGLGRSDRALGQR